MASETRVGRGIVITASLLGLFFLVQGLATDYGLFRSFVNGVVAAFAVMVLGGSGRRFWRGDKVEGAQAPGGWGVNFAKATLRPLRALEERLNKQMDAVNVRLLAVEEGLAAIKELPPEPDIKE